MLDNQVIEDLIQAQITKVAEEKVSAILQQSKWLDGVEQKIISHVQDRITARFANIATMPDLVHTVQSSVVELIDAGHVPNMLSYVDQNKLSLAIDNGIQTLVSQTIDNLIVDSTWLAKIETLVNQSMTRKVSSLMSNIDLVELINKEMDSGFNRWQERFQQNFKTQGIVDNALNTELTIMDGVAVIEHDLVSKNLSVMQDAEVKGTLSVFNLSVRGDINTDNASWQRLSSHIAEKTLEKLHEEWKQKLVGEVLELSKTQGIEFSSVSIGGQHLIDGNSLHNEITQSNIQKLGTLQDLTVDGRVKFSDTMLVTNNRVGINTQSPEMALSVWDDDISIIAGKHSKQTGYIGTSRLTNLAIGINRTPYIEIDTDGLTTIKQLRLGQHRISFAPALPGYAGTRGDLVINSDPKPNTAFAWQCLGSFRWQPLMAAN